jgi:uncharacterized protein YndB with AHSA1/START domain
MSVVEFERTFLIKRPREEVFRFITDPANDPQWKPHVLESSPVPDTIQAGTTWRQLQRGPFGKAEVMEQCTAIEEDLLFSQTCPYPMPHGGTYAFESVPDGTQVTTRGHVQLRGPMKVLKPLVARMASRDLDKSLAALKSVLEHPEPTTP